MKLQLNGNRSKQNEYVKRKLISSRDFEIELLENLIFSIVIRHNQYYMIVIGWFISILFGICFQHYHLQSVTVPKSICGHLCFKLITTLANVLASSIAECSLPMRVILRSCNASAKLQLCLSKIAVCPFFNKKSGVRMKILKL